MSAVKVDRDDLVAGQLLVGFVLLLIGAWIIAPPLALVLGGAGLVYNALRRA